MSKERELLNKAIEMIQIVPLMASIGHAAPDFGSELILEIQELLAQPEQEQEPVAWIATGIGGGTAVGWYEKDIVNLPKGTKLYLHPPKREPLSDEEIDKGYQESDGNYYDLAFRDGVRFAEKHHGIGGGE